MRITNDRQFYPHSLDGDQPEMLWGSATPNAAEGPWKQAAEGSLYVRKNGNQKELWQKVEESGRSSDWLLIAGSISKRLVKADFTDSTTTGTYEFTEEIPIGALATYSTVSDVVAFSGDTTAVVTIGDNAGSPDVDRYNTGTPSVFATIAQLSVGAVSGTAYHAAAVKPRVIITAATDFTATSALGALTVKINYRM